MRIGMILDKTFPPDPRVENEAISLIDEGHEIFLFCLNNATQKKSEVIKGIQVKRYNSNRLIYKLSALVYTIPCYTSIMSKKINHFLTLNKIESIHIHDMQIAEAVFKANKALKLKTVLDLHENRPEIMKFYPHLQKFLGKYLISVKKWRMKEEEFINKATKVIVVTEESKSEIIDRVGIKANKIVVTPNTVHKSYFEKAIFDAKIVNEYRNNFVILYVGDTGLRRGLQTVIKSVFELKDKIKSIKLVIVGCNTSDAILKKQVRALKLEKYVDFQGWKNETLFPSYIKASSICISPLHRNLHHDTTYANKLFQYMSFAKPVLVSNATAQKNIIENTNAGLVHNAEDSCSFTEKVLELYQSESLQMKLGKNGERFIKEKFHWERTSKNLIDLYTNLGK